MAGRSHRWALSLLGLAGCPQFQNDDWTVTGDASSTQPTGDASNGLPMPGTDADARSSDATVPEAQGADAESSEDGAALDQAAAPEDGPGSGLGTDADAGMGSETQTRDASTSDGPPVAQRLYCGLTVPRGITLVDADVCWVGNVSPRGLFCALASGGGNIRPMAGPNDATFLLDAFDLLFDATYIYWSNGQNNQVIRRPRSGGQPQEYFTGGGRLSFLTPGDGATIWATDFADPSDLGGVSAGEVVVGPSSGGGTASNAIYTAQAGAAGVAVYNGNVYWGMPDGLAFGSLTGNAMIYHVTSIETPVAGVAVDTAGVAYFLAGNQSLYRYATGTAGPAPMYRAPRPFGAGDVAVDDQNVYFSEPDLGCIMRIAKQ